MEALGINLGFFLFQVFNFSILAILLYAFAYKPLVNMLEQRKTKIAQGLEDAQVAAEARANAEREAEKVLADAQTKASNVVRDATERAEAAGREVRAEMEAEAAKAKDVALAEAAVERDRMLADVRGQIAALAMAATQKLVGEALDEKRQHALLDEFFSGVKAGKVVVLEGTALAGSSAEITSALPLTEAEQNTVKKDVLSKIGDQATVAFRVDPSILGGLVIRVGDKVLDNSVAGQMEGLRQKLV
ncbi:MAG TPA: ATP synthase F0 subunit B [Chloroflexi bacterium]|nr:ATP synthase F0 subunit B [Chloroflexota bacterium]HBY09081.1 ATP synthase F0 subunit B [Chloroflexota bacterium]